MRNKNFIRETKYVSFKVKETIEYIFLKQLLNCNFNSKSEDVNQTN